MNFKIKISQILRLQLTQVTEMKKKNQTIKICLPFLELKNTKWAPLLKKLIYSYSLNIQRKIKEKNGEIVAEKQRVKEKEKIN